MFSFQFTAVSGLLTVSAFYISLISTLTSAVRGQRREAVAIHPYHSRFCQFVTLLIDWGKRALQCLSNVEQGIEMVPLEYSCHTR